MANVFERQGADAWFEADTPALLPEGTRCPECQGEAFEREMDILDVWFDSGVSHAAVLESRDYLTWPADMYLEGSDQHRGFVNIVSKGHNYFFPVFPGIAYACIYMA